MAGSNKELFDTAEHIAERFKEQKFNKVLIISHIDADGLSAASIASTALQREGLAYEIKFIKQLDEAVIADLKGVLGSSGAADLGILFWFMDLGSGMVKNISQFKPVITDHHAPSLDNYDVPIQARTDLLSLGDALTKQIDEFHLNPHLFDLDGTFDISGAGTVYLVARALNPNNTDLAHLAVIGAVGDLQDSMFRRLTGTNRKILEDAVNVGKIDAKTDISSYGRETRSLQTLLMYTIDPDIPGLSMNEVNCIKFLKKLNIQLSTDGRPRHWVDLTIDERRSILSELMELMLAKGIGHKEANRLFGEAYILPDETVGTSLHDAKEFATLLNSCGKYNRPEIGHNICLGDREEQLKSAYQLLKEHRSILMNGMQFVRGLGINDHGAIQYFDAGDKIPDNIIGTIINMILNNVEVDQNKPLFGFVLAEEGDRLKVSARTTRDLVKKGLNLSTVMKQISDIFGSGSVGGGHDIAAGATIPLGKQEEFLKYADEIVKEQFGIQNI